MHKAKRWRYYCDFCKKAGGSGGHMARHEKHCTMNPDRECGVCFNMLEIERKPMSELVALLPDGKGYLQEEQDEMISYGTLQKEAEKAMPALREATENCPACIMAALRQAGIPIPMVESFNFTKEMASIWADINHVNAMSDYDRSHYC